MDFALVCFLESTFLISTDGGFLISTDEGFLISIDGGFLISFYLDSSKFLHYLFMNACIGIDILA
jgi:hypothetical protein